MLLLTLKILECVAINLTLVYATVAYIRVKRTNLDELMVSYKSVW